MFSSWRGVLFTFALFLSLHLLLFCYNDDGDTFNFVCMYNIFIMIIFSSELSFLFLCRLYQFSATFVSFIAYFSLSLRMYVLRRVLDVFRRVFHYDCVLLMLYFCCFDRLFSDWLRCGFFFTFQYFILILLLFLYFCFTIVVSFVIISWSFTCIMFSWLHQLIMYLLWCTIATFICT